MKKLISILLGFFMVAVPAFAFADTASTTSAQVQSMLTQIQNLQAQLKVFHDAQTALQTAQSNISQTFGLIRNLRQGMSGGDVSALQAILASDPTIYPQGLITGFFGKMTSEALRKFQRKHGIDALGFAGPKTLKKLNDEARRLGLSEENDDNNTTSTSHREDDRGENGEHGKKLCAKIPPGQLIAPGWLKHHEDDDKPIIPPCQILPPGIVNNLPQTTTSDTVAPTISLVATFGTTGTGTNVTWTTDESSNSKVWYATTNPLATSSATLSASATLVTSHTLPLSGLATSTTYYYIVGSSDSSGNATTSSQFSFTTNSI